jgi:hypothetical protein
MKIFAFQRRHVVSRPTDHAVAARVAQTPDREESLLNLTLEE